MTTAFLYLLGGMFVLCLVPVLILRGWMKPEPKPFPHMEPEDLMDDEECEHEWEPVTTGFAECKHCHEEKEW